MALICVRDSSRVAGLLLTAEELVAEGCELGAGGATENEGAEEDGVEDEGAEFVSSLDVMSEDTSEDDSKDSCCEEDGACEMLCDTCICSGDAVLKTGLPAQEVTLKHSNNAIANAISLFFIIKTSQINFSKSDNENSISHLFFFFHTKYMEATSFCYRIPVSSCFFTVFMLKCVGFRMRC